MHHFIQQIHIDNEKQFKQLFASSVYYNCNTWTTVQSWDLNCDADFFLVDDAVLIARSRDLSHGMEMTYTLLYEDGSVDLVDTLRRLHDSGTDIYGNDWSSTELSFVTTAAAKNFQNILSDYPYALEEKRDEFEYIYLPEKLTMPTGNAMRRFREKLVLFERHYGAATLRKISHEQSDLAKMVNDIHRWDITHTNSMNDKTLSEGKVINNILTRYLSSEIHIYALEVEGSVAAYAICTYPENRDVLDVTHLECNYHFRGIFDTMIHYLAKRYLEYYSIKEVNLSCDLGISGLRQHKMGLRPIRFNEVYSLVPKLDRSIEHAR